MDVYSKPKVIAVVGPTASGKTGLSVELAKAINGEIISADSMQIYKYLNVGTAKVTNEEMQGIKHHCVDFLEPHERFSVADFMRCASIAVEDITSRGKTPILVGGTGQYVESFLKGMRLSEQKTNDELRAKLALRLKQEGSEKLYAELLEIDPIASEKIHPNNTVRVLRALEHYYATGQTISTQKELSLPESPPYDSLILGLTFDDRAHLYERINLRVDIMMQKGLLKEAEFVYKNKEQYLTAAQAIGYKEFFDYFEKNAQLEDCVCALKQASRRYAKRQLTWFAHMQDIVWIKAGENAKSEAVLTVKEFLVKE